MQAARRNGFRVATNRGELLALKPDDRRTIAYQHAGNSTALQYEIDRPDDHASLADFTRKGIELLDTLLASCDGRATFFVTDLQMMMMGGGAMPVGIVLGSENPAETSKALRDLIVLADGDDGEPAEGAAGLEKYRNIEIRTYGDFMPVSVGHVKDRVVLALSDQAFKAVIDSTLDKTVAMEPGSQGEKLLNLSGEGSAFFTMDLAGIAQAFWPMLAQLSAMEPEDVPFASLPSAQKMVRMLGPEVAVMRPDAGGVLLSSRGKIPFATKVVLWYPPVLGGFFFMMMM